MRARRPRLLRPPCAARQPQLVDNHPSCTAQSSELHLSWGTIIRAVRQSSESDSDTIARSRGHGSRLPSDRIRVGHGIWSCRPPRPRASPPCAHESALAAPARARARARVRACEPARACACAACLPACAHARAARGCVAGPARLGYLSVGAWAAHPWAGAFGICGRGRAAGGGPVARWARRPASARIATQTSASRACAHARDDLGGAEGP